MSVAISNLEFAYGDGGFRLAVPQLEIKPGEKVAFVGPSGSGKTTLLRLMAGVHLPERGDIVSSGQALNGLSDAARRAFRIQEAGFVFQDFELIEYLNVRENILLAYRINPALALTAEVRARAEELASALGLADKLKRRVDQLSQGEKQRVAIGRALLPKPKLILADEPTGNLDPDNKRRIVEILFGQADRAGATLIVVTHDHSLLEGFDRVIDFAQFHSATGGGR
jgi:putative ABC transport system ATP-binding protein